MDEAVDIVRGLSAGGYFEFHGECYDIPSVMMSPTPTEPLPILIGGHADAALRRAARGDGWLHGGGDPADLPGLLATLAELRAGGGHRRQALRGPRHLARRLHPRRHPPSRGGRGHRRHRRLPVALRRRSRTPSPCRPSWTTSALRRRRHRQGGPLSAAEGRRYCPTRPRARQALHGRRRGGRPGGWLALFADDAVVEDPIGPSAFDPEGRGHRGPAAIAAFYDNVIAANESIRFDIRQSFLCGDEVANVGIIRIGFAGGAAVEVDGSTATAGRRTARSPRSGPSGSRTRSAPSSSPAPFSRRGGTASRTAIGADQSGMARTICTSLMCRSRNAPSQ